MKHTLIAAVAGAFLASSALAQTIIVEPQQQTVIQEYITQAPRAQVEVQEEISVGMTLPTEVQLQPVPQTIYAEVPAAKEYHYVLVEEQFVLVEPGTRRVVQVIAVN